MSPFARAKPKVLKDARGDIHRRVHEPLTESYRITPAIVCLDLQADVLPHGLKTRKTADWPIFYMWRSA